METERLHIRSLHFTPSVFVNVVNISKSAYEIYLSFVIKFNNTSSDALMPVRLTFPEAEREKKETNDDRQIHVHVEELQ